MRPFSGVLTKRNVDPGALINAGAGAAGRELFDIARVDPLRVYTSVPQAYAPFIRAGESTAVTLQEFPGQKFSAKVARTAEAIDPNTRTLLTEVDVPNKDGRLLPGSFGEVHFAVGSNVNKVTVPVNAMLFRSEGAQLAVVGPDKKIQLRSISIGKDYGTTLEILGGVTTEDQIVINPPDSLEAGQQVNLAPPSPGQGANPSPAQQPAISTEHAATGKSSRGQQQNTQSQPGSQNGQQNKPTSHKGSKSVKKSMMAPLLMLLVLGAGCTVGPRYVRPSAPTPAPDAWKTQPPWQQAAPKDAIPKGAWWQVFQDPDARRL